ncbi:hypothetical protein M409DRAFT_60100 [Zasmidium cellare ATCC 36951]|uniref:Uncharacterized protein n=1 Tax=Zasmidium cellare ATCC 36951 TaxID=1080233 RepID=A0A6A6C0L0_ZASCE|nr:uncharacterized protein M409DRAFT_60100 [Zasmidium cellare ATCC 36951]KAF2160413.1 hypothetical protein M409DRAFT_60100 [Zasmidium cellare ATCC 36951]
MLSEYPQYDGYWRLSQWYCKKKADILEHVQKQGRIVTRYTPKSQLVTKQNLTDRGSLPYESEAISLEELQRFIRDRRLQSSGETPRRAECVEVLEKADEEQKFENCRLLRKDALPLFYQSTVFNLYYCYEKTPGKKTSLQHCLETTLFLKSLSSTPGPSTIVFNIGYHPRPVWNGKRETIEQIARCSISLPTSSVQVEIVGRHQGLYSKAQLLRLKDGLEKMLERNLKVLCEEGDGTKKLGEKERGCLLQAAYSAYHTCLWVMQNPVRGRR